MRFSMRIVISVLAIFALTAVAGCTRTTQEYKPRSLGAKSTPSLEAVTQAVLRAGRAQDWEMVVQEPGLIRAKTIWGGGKHNIVVNVVYSTKDYTLKYVSSKNLKSGDGTIHRTYNRLTNRLYDQIHTETSKL